MSLTKNGFIRRALAPVFALAVLSTVSGCYKDALDGMNIGSRGAGVAINGYSPIGAVNPGDRTYVWFWNYGTRRWSQLTSTTYGTTPTHHGNYDWVYFDFGSVSIPSAGWALEGGSWHAKVVVRRTQPNLTLVPETWAMTQPEKDCASSYIGNGGEFVLLGSQCGADPILDLYGN